MLSQARQAMILGGKCRQLHAVDFRTALVRAQGVHIFHLLLCIVGSQMFNSCNILYKLMEPCAPVCKTVAKIDQQAALKGA